MRPSWTHWARWAKVEGLTSKRHLKVKSAGRFKSRLAMNVGDIMGVQLSGIGYSIKER